MKNNLLFIFTIFIICFCKSLLAQEIDITANKINLDNINKITKFEGNVNAEDKYKNKIKTENADYKKENDVFETFGKTEILTSSGYKIFTSNIVLDNNKKNIYSNENTEIIDKDGNKINVSMFAYSTINNIFFSKGKIEIKDKNNNKYNFSEIYINTIEKKIIGTDAKAFLNQETLSANKNNEPRLFANTMLLSNNNNTIEKGIFTYCKDRGKDTCPPWRLQAKKIEHNLAKKTIYYNNVTLKIYDFPIFFFPKFSHPDPTVKRRSGFLVPSLSNSTTVGSGFKIPYFWDIANDKDLTLTPKLYLNENPLLLAEYRQDFEKSFLILDTSYTAGYKKKDNLKSDGGRTHLFGKLNHTFIDKEDETSELEINIQKVSNDTYFKVHDIKTELVDKDNPILENSLDYFYQNKNFFLSLTPSYYEDTTKVGNLRHEYLLPITIEKNLIANDKFGYLDLTSNLKIRNYETNKRTDFFVNDLNWKSNKSINKFGAETYFEANLKGVNYEAKNTNEYKNDNFNTELKSSLGYFAKLDLFKKDLKNNFFKTLTPKFLLRYAPGNMRKIDSQRLTYDNLFSLNKINELDTIENGLSTSIGFDYKINKFNKNNSVGDDVFSFSAGQVISEKENKKMPSNSSLDQKFSDVVGKATYNINNKLDINYNFSLDQNYKELNYNEIGANYYMDDKVKFNLSYLQEKNHIGNQEFVSSGIDYKINDSTELSFSTKRNLLTSSAEFYNLSYNYINDCLKAGIAYRREFYTDRDVEPNNTLMFTISIIPFAEINSPSISR